MSSILKRANVVHDDLRFPLRQPFRVAAFVGKTDEPPRQEGFGLVEQHRLEVKVFVRFWASSAQLPSATRMAERVLLQDLHADVLGHVSKLRLAIHSGDTDSAMSICDQIEKDIGL